MLILPFPFLKSTSLARVNCSGSGGTPKGTCLSHWGDTNALLTVVKTDVLSMINL